eukprot:1783313-Pleurochrysis_carterae.AAC.2
MLSSRSLRPVQTDVLLPLARIEAGVRAKPLCVARVRRRQVKIARSLEGGGQPPAPTELKRADPSEKVTPLSFLTLHVRGQSSGVRAADRLRLPNSSLLLFASIVSERRPPATRLQPSTPHHHRHRHHLGSRGPEH